MINVLTLNIFVKIFVTIFQRLLRLGSQNETRGEATTPLRFFKNDDYPIGELSVSLFLQLLFFKLCSNRLGTLITV